MDKNECEHSTIIQNEITNADNPFVKLPAELFLNICKHLSARCVLKQLSLVCKQFNKYINDDFTWKYRIFKRWSQQYPAVECMWYNN